jgi:hypothetical protein
MTSNILAIFAWAVDEFFDVIKPERSFIDVLASCQCLDKVLVFQFPVLRVRKVIKLWPFFNVIFCIPHSSSNLSFYSKHLIKSQLSFLQFFKTLKLTRTHIKQSECDFFVKGCLQWSEISLIVIFFVDIISHVVIVRYVIL